MMRKILKIFILFTSAVVFYADGSLAQFSSSKMGERVELNGDTVEYSIDGNKVTAQGNVVLIYQDITLTCDVLEFSKDTKDVEAQGHVHMISKQGDMRGSKLKYNFVTGEGEFNGARIANSPFYGESRRVMRITSTKLKLQDSYITTCDLDKPHFRLVSRKIDVYPGEKMVARNTRLVVGKVPLIFIPKFSQNLKDSKPRVIFTPGYDKEWGIFLLTQWRYYFNDDFKGTIHLDARELKDIAEGLDLSYNTKKWGSGLIRTYYMNERSITSKRWFQERPSPTIERERFKAEWRHKWTIDDETEAIWQYYKLSDNTFSKDYFRREFDKDAAPKTFFLLTRRSPVGLFSLRADDRVNRFESIVERLPEARYDLSNQKLGDSDFYIRNISIFSNLSRKNASPTEVRLETKRFDFDNELSYVRKVGIFEVKPFVGGSETFYTKTKDVNDYNIIRGQLRTGASMSTKFYKVMDVESKWMGLDIQRLRHVFTPTVSYIYAHDPTFDINKLDQFDEIDSRSYDHTVNFAFENKLQTKRLDKTVDLFRMLVGTDFRLKGYPTGGGFDTIKSDADFKPTDWLSLYFDSQYDTRKDYLSTANFDLYINGGKKWTLGIGKRLHHDVDDQVTTEIMYKFNPLWAIRFFQRFDVDRGILKEQEYHLTRDLHEWTMDLMFNQTRGEGSEILMLFTLKAFPDIGLDFGSGFNRRKAGSQSSEGL